MHVFKQLPASGQLPLFLQFAFTDKSTNLYELPKENYKKLLHDSITQTHKKTPVNA